MGLNFESSLIMSPAVDSHFVYWQTLGKS